MRRCPACDACYADEVVHCDVDGTALVSDARSGHLVSDTRGFALEAPTAVPPSVCPECQQPYPPGDEGYCLACGQRNSRLRTIPSIPLGTRVGPYSVSAILNRDTLQGRDDGGTEAVIVLGESAPLSDELAATKALPEHVLGPRVLGLGEDAQRGPYLALVPEPLGTLPLREAAPSMRLSDAAVLMRVVLDVTASLERAGFRWSPVAADFALLGTRLSLSRLRVSRLTEARADACCPVATFGRAFLPLPAMFAPPALYKLLTGVGLEGSHVSRSAEEVASALAVAETALEEAPSRAPVAALCDVGLKRATNDDASAIAMGEANGERWAVLVVCDGVSSAPNAGRAARIAAGGARDALAAFAQGANLQNGHAEHAMRGAIRAAHAAVCAAGLGDADGDQPGTTIVAAVVVGCRATIGWVGDSRAYWIGQLASELLTRDHSWAMEAVATGAMSEAEAMQQPLAHALTRCLGPLDGGTTEEGLPTTEPEIVTHEIGDSGHLVLCTDGLWNYFPEASAIRDLIAAAGRDAESDKIARALVNSALLRGGGDNVTVGVYKLDTPAR